MSRYLQLDRITLYNIKISEIFSNPNAMYFLAPFLYQPRTLSEASKELDVPMNSYYYWIKKFLSLGVLIIAYEEKRIGSSIKYYITPAKEIMLEIDDASYVIDSFVNRALEGYQVVNKFVISSFKSLVGNKNIELENSKLGMLLKTEGSDYFVNIVLLSDDNEYFMTTEVLKKDLPSVALLLRQLVLKPKDAKSLQRKLAKLVYEYDKKYTENGEKFLLQVTLTPGSLIED